MRTLKEALINKHNIRNVSIEIPMIDINKIRFDDIEPGMIVEIQEDQGKVTAKKYLNLVVAVSDLEEDIRDNVDLFVKLVLLTPNDTNGIGFTFWRLKEFKKDFSKHCYFGPDVMITHIWNTKINTKSMSVDKLNKIINEIKKRIERK